MHVAWLCTQVIKRFIMHSKKTAFIVEHDFIMATYLADRVIVYEGEPSKKAFATAPQQLQTGESTSHTSFPALARGVAHVHFRVSAVRRWLQHACHRAAAGADR